MKSWIIWKFGRGSFQYDVLCGLILIAIILIPQAVFNDRPDFMRMSSPDEVQRVLDDDGNVVYMVQVNTRIFARPSPGLEQDARDALQAFLRSDEPIEIYRTESVDNTRGTLAAYAFWVVQQ